MAVFREPRRLSDGFVTLDGGMDSGKSAVLINPNQSAFSVNVTHRHGFPQTRPGFVYRALTYENTEEETWFTTKNVQAAKVYSPFTGLPSIIALIGGRLWRVDVEAYTVIEITPSETTTTTANFIVPAVGADVTISVASNSRIFVGYPVKINQKIYTVQSKSLLTLTIRNVNDTPTDTVTSGSTVNYLIPSPETIEVAHMEQAEEFMVIQDGQSYPIFYNGAVATIGNKVGDLPVGTVLTYGLGRIWVAKGREFAAGDIVNGDEILGRANVLKFTENTYLAEGGAFALPMQSGSVTGMIFTANLDASLGQGELLIGSARGIASVNVPPDRDTWKNLQYPVQRISALEYGPLSHESMVLVNSDVFYRARDGIRSFVIARRDFGTWGNTPISKEMARVLDLDSQGLLNFVSAVNFDNRYLITVSPVKVTNGCYFKGLVALDFDLISSMGRKAPPAYDGLWTGINPTKILKGEFEGEDRCFVFHRNDDEENELWEISKTERFDTTPEGERRIKSFIETRSFNFETVNQIKKLQTADVFFDNVVGEVDFDVKFRPDQYPVWTDWASWSEEAIYKKCPTTGCLTLGNYQPQFRPRMRLPQPSDACEESTGRPLRFGYEFQGRIQWTGFARLKTFVMYADITDEEPFGECRLDGTAKTIDSCPIDPYEL